jgi:hypothetical protein
MNPDNVQGLLIVVAAYQMACDLVADIGDVDGLFALVDAAGMRGDSRIAALAALSSPVGAALGPDATADYLRRIVAEQPESAADIRDVLLRAVP